jgi:hypothetical protein
MRKQLDMDNIVQLSISEKSQLAVIALKVMEADVEGVGWITLRIDNELLIPLYVAIAAGLEALDEKVK